MTITGIEAITGGFSGLSGTLSASEASGVDAASSLNGPEGPDGAKFADLLGNQMDNLEAISDKSDQLAIDAASGKLDNIHDYTIAASEAAVLTQLTTSVRNRALDAFTEIMRMPVG
jgi:flagellar hook-basal body complex protein FliE